MAAEAEQVERARRGLVTGPIRVSMPYRADRTNALAAATITSLCAFRPCGLRACLSYSKGWGKQVARYRRSISLMG
jgi:hypothetical protein